LSDSCTTPWAGGAVAEERDDDPIGSREPRRQRGAGADGQPGRHDAVAAEDVEVQRGDVHGSAEAAAVPVLPSHQLGHHPVHPRALGDAMAVAAVGPDDVVVLAQRRAGAGRDRLLADVGVRRSLHQALVEQLHRALVEPADLHHRRVQALEALAADLHETSPVRRLDHDARCGVKRREPASRLPGR